MIRTTALVLLVFVASCERQDAREAEAAPSSGVFSRFIPLPTKWKGDVVSGRDQIVILGSGDAEWWEGSERVVAELPWVTMVDARWVPGHNALRIGPGVLDLAARQWRADPIFEYWTRRQRDGWQPLRDVIWTADLAHVVLHRQHIELNGRHEHELVILAAADGRVRGRLKLKGSTKEIAATSDRVFVGMTGRRALLLDLDANEIKTPAPLPDFVNHVREGAGMFAIVGLQDEVTLYRPSDGAVITTWDAHAHDVALFHHGVLAIDQAGILRVMCLEGSQVRQVAEVATKRTLLPKIAIAGKQVVVVGDPPHPLGPPMVAARFKPPCL